MTTLYQGLYGLQTKLIVEPRLREQFEIANPTEPYKRLLDCLPGEFVGVASKLQTLVEAVSTAMAEAFKAQDMALPPWRRTSAALSKWNLVRPFLDCKLSMPYCWHHNGCFAKY